MSIMNIDYTTLIQKLKQDNASVRFNARIILVNNFKMYFRLIEELSDMVDLVINLSDPKICTGTDTVPDLKAVLNQLETNSNSNVLITSIGEYLRFGLSTELNKRGLFSIISRQAHSKKRVYIPIFAAKDEFCSAVGELDEEHYPEMVYELEDTPLGFSVTVYSKTFSMLPGLKMANGLREWLSLWDSKTIKSNTAVTTRHANQIKENAGLYSVSVVTEPSRYFETRIFSDTRIDFSLGSNTQWLYLASFAHKACTPLREAIKRALNLIDFDPLQILNAWGTADENTKWLFWLWYKLGLNQESDYYSYSVLSASNFSTIPSRLECAILNCLENPKLDDWIIQRNDALQALRLERFCDDFWKAFDAIADERKKLKILGNQTLDERCKIIEIVSVALKNGRTLSDFKVLLAEKYPDLLLYLTRNQYISGDLQSYIANYKTLKVKDEFSITLSDATENINYYDFDTRSQLLNSILMNRSAYYLWIDGMGVEWIDLLVEKIAAADSELSSPRVCIGTAVLPTITEANMACADPLTVTRKINDLDSLSHIKDKSECNYFKIIAKQIDLISAIAQDIACIAAEHPNLDIVITADHGMSRMAAKAFHGSYGGVQVDKTVEVCSHGRYCRLIKNQTHLDFSHTLKDNGVIAFRNHSHFTSSGHAPGEVHGGAAPEEILIPVIHYKRTPVVLSKSTVGCSYQVPGTVTRNASGICDIPITTTGDVTKVTIEINSKRIAGKLVSANNWIVPVSGLDTNRNYNFHVYLNNIYSSKEETIFVKNKGFVIDDDF